MKNQAALFLTILLFFTAACSRQDDAGKLVQKVKPFVDEGFKAFSAQNYPSAVKAWEAALKINPKLEYLQLNLGICYYAMGQRERALTLWMAYREANPNDPEVFNNLGGYYRDLPDYPKAIEYYQEAIKLSPQYLLPHYNIGLIRYEQGDYPASVESYKQSLLIAPKDIRTLLALGRAYRAMGDDANALESFQKAKLYAPADTMARFHFAMELIRVKKLDQAKVEFDELAADTGNAPMSQYGLASVALAGTPDPTVVQGYLAAGKQVGAQDSVLFTGLEAELLLAQGQHEQAFALLRDVVDKMPAEFDVKRSEYLFLLGKSEVGSDPVKAREHLQSSLKAFPMTQHKQEIEQLLAQLG